jgi:hypothetical protein
VYRSVTIIAVSLAVFAASSPASAQGFLTQRASFYGWIPGSNITMRGRITMGILSRRGTFRGRTNKGVRCTGRTSLSASLSGGSGSMRCRDGRSGRFRYRLSSRLPPRGRGSGRMSNGQRMLFKISP